MRIEKLTLHNFRQFINTQTIEFSTGKEKNVTVLIGDNTSGKTTLIRAFEWILYGKNAFEDKSLLNKNVADNMIAGETQEVQGILWINHNGLDYEIVRRITYTSIGNGQVRGGRTEARISYLQPDGQTKTVRSDFSQNIERILPQKLSGYFFFGGERLADITGKEDIEGSVKGLMGLDVLSNAIGHLKSVSGKLKKNLDFSKDEEARKAQSDLETKQEALREEEKELQNIEEQLIYYRDEKERYAALLKENEKVAEEQKRRERIVITIKSLEERLKKSQNEMVTLFSRDAFTFFGIPLLKEAVNLLNDARDEVESVPDMTAAAIDYLLQRGYCMCGQKIEKGSPLEESLLKERAKQPPEAIGSLVRRFREQALEYHTASEEYERNLISKHNDILSLREELGVSRDEKKQLDERLRNTKDVAQLENEYWRAEERIEEFEKKKAEKREIVGVLKNDIGNLEWKLDNYSQNDEKNTRIKLMMDYADAVKEWVQTAYFDREKRIREELEKKVNENFQKIYHGSRTIMIDEKYHIKYYDVTMDESDGLKAVKSLAFVSGLVELAKDVMPSESGLDVGPAYYPLVMDGPFSNIDEKHIENVSKIMPEAAEQVIIAVMKKDWEKAFPFMGKYVEKAYTIEKPTDGTGRLIETIAHIKAWEV